MDRILDGQRPCSPDALVAEMMDRSGVSYDAPGWPLGANSVFIVRSATIACRGTLHGPVEPVWKVIADFKGLPWVRMLLWLVCHERVLTNVERERRRLTHNLSCIVCGNGKDDLDHILRFCPTTFCLWNQLIRPDAWNVYFTLPIKAWLLENLTTPFKFVASAHSMCMAETVSLSATTQVRTANADLPTNELNIDLGKFDLSMSVGVVMHWPTEWRREHLVMILLFSVYHGCGCVSRLLELNHGGTVGCFGSLLV
ncbi:hypothetical protein V6N12_049867 [Hibiscus sabdariffa]|uniref:Reverse transcriptase zinc-binding domain-containing protein n=1 Tax=Hibiscus sabdariffa TaxID=183260 RepID=A0ABR2GB39_9ROSI